MSLAKLNKHKYFIVTIVIGLVAIWLALFVFYMTANEALVLPAPIVRTIIPVYKTIKVGNATIKSQLLTTKAEWIQGLSGKTSLAPNTGDLFVFNKSDYWGIWMKDMNFPIDVLWITANMQISDIVENMSPASYPTDYKPHQPVLYVLEVPTGTVKSNNIKVGQSFSLL